VALSFAESKTINAGKIISSARRKVRDLQIKRDAGFLSITTVNVGLRNKRTDQLRPHPCFFQMAKDLFTQGLLAFLVQSSKW